jgi:hypothetical protein
MACYGDSFTILHVDNVRTSQETHLWASMACYGNSFTTLHVDNVRTSQETHLWASMVCYGVSFTILHVDNVRTSQETPVGLHGLLRGELCSFLSFVRRVGNCSGPQRALCSESAVAARSCLCTRISRGSPLLHARYRKGYGALSIMSLLTLGLPADVTVSP